jgi:membrane glycosyltransferase
MQPTSFLPPELPLAMPVQSLREPHTRSPRPATSRPSFALRRLYVIAAAAAMTVAAAYEMYNVLKVSGVTLPEASLLVLFVALFAWIAYSFASGLAGFLCLLGRRRNDLGMDTEGPLPELRSSNALLVPTYNEEPRRVLSRLQAIYESVEQTGHLAHFDVFILSDTTDPDIWIEEESALLALRERLGTERIYYRHRAKNTERKAGNISDWVRRFGGGYEHMIVLDADSLMAGDTIVRLAAAMERLPTVALIQTLPVVVNGRTLFARLQQFAGRVYGPMIAAGVAWWHGSEGNYWGHNAIIRVAAFAAHAGLPTMRGRSPFGGHILSHDFVEAALMRRAGWAVHMVPELGGSFEEAPPTMTDYALRDRRWCQGNMQHLGVLPARGLHWVSRLHLLTGIGSYITAPLWLMFLLIGLLVSLYAQFVPPDYFPSDFSLFPQWPAQDPIRAAWVFGATMAVLLVPKLLAYAAMLTRPAERRGSGGGIRALLSLLLETVISGLAAPVMMVFQSRAMAQILAGHDAGWQVQRRDDGSVPFGELLRQYAPHTLMGVGLAAAAFAVSTSLFLWMTPVIVGLLFAIPTVAVTSQAGLGIALRRAGLFLIPEERAVPEILDRANTLAAENSGGTPQPALLRLARDPMLLAAHVAMTEPVPRTRGDVDVHLAVARAKLEDAATLDEAMQFLSLRETFAVLTDEATLRAAIGKQPDDQRTI